MAEFEYPAFLENHGTDELQNLGLSAFPADIDASEGGHTWNVTRAAALIAAEICEYIIPESIRVFLPEWSYGTYLRAHAKARNITVLEATAATGEITITGAVGTVIPQGSLFLTTAINDEPSSEYRTTEAATIPESKSVTVGVECVSPGISGNTAANTIVHVGSRINGITSVTNAEAITGGTEEETDESLIKRICEYDKSLGDSFVGCAADYKSWAESVNGVGAANVIPAQDTSGLVTIVLLDSNGDPATETLCESVYNEIMAPDDPYKRKAPIGASLSVIAPETLEIAIKATVELEDGAAIEDVNEAFLALLLEYLPEAMKDGEIKYTRITRALSKTVGVNDYADVQFGIVGDDGAVTYGVSNIAISNRSIPAIIREGLHLTAGTV